jgi:hypothetical protein
MDTTTVIGFGEADSQKLVTDQLDDDVTLPITLAEMEQGRWSTGSSENQAKNEAVQPWKHRHIHMWHVNSKTYV